MDTDPHSSVSHKIGKLTLQEIWLGEEDPLDMLGDTNTW